MIKKQSTLQSLINTMADSCALLNSSGGIVYYNTLFTSLLKDSDRDSSSITVAALPGGDAYWQEQLALSAQGKPVAGTVHNSVQWSLIPILDNNQAFFLLHIQPPLPQQTPLHATNSILKQFIDVTKTFIVVLDRHGTVILINETGSRILGARTEKIVGEDWFQFAVDENSLSSSKHIFQNILDGKIEAFRHVESEIRSVHGARHTMNWHNDIIRDEHGSISFVICSGDDITEKRKSERELLHTNEKYRKLSDNINDIFFSIDENHTVLYWNACAGKMTGIAESEILGKSLSTFLPDFDTPEIADKVTEVIQSQSPAQEQIHTQIHEKEKTFNLIIYPVANGVSILAKDMSAQIRFQAQLFEQSQILDQLHEAVITTDHAGIIKTVNKQCLHIFKSSVSKIKSAHISTIFREQDRSRLIELLEHITQDTPYASEEYRIFTADKETIHALVHISIKTNLYEEHDGFIFSIINISESASIRKEILKINADLEEKVKQRTLQLEHAKQRAETANSAKSSFLSNMSHEVRTPMNAVVGLVHLLSKTNLTDIQTEYCTKINNASQNMLTIINDILDYSKIESGNMELRTERFNLETILQKLRQKLLSYIENKTIISSFIINENVPRSILSDQVRIEQILSLLLHNAAKFTETGTISLQIFTTPLTFNTDSFTFRVSDTGIGMPKKDIKRMFSPFTQADDSRSRKYGGAGLGLALCKQLVTQMGGQVSVSSTPGQGSTFSVSIPVTRADTVSSHEMQSDLPVHVTAVDPEESSRRALSLIFRSYGISHTIKEELCNGQETPSTSSSVWIISLSAFSTQEDVEIIIPKLANKRVIILIDYPGQSVPEPLKTAYAIKKPFLRSHIFAALTQAGSPYTATTAPREKRLQNIRVLIVEDNVINRDVAQEILALEGAQTDYANNGKEALETLKNNPFDVILMDIKMPVMDGITAATHIKGDPVLSSIPIIALSANPEQEKKQKHAETYFTDVISKPFDINDLFDKINMHTAAQNMRKRTPDTMLNKIKPIHGINMREPIAEQNITLEEYYEQLNSFYRSHTTTLNSMKEAYTQKDGDRLQNIIENLEKESRTIGAHEVAEVCRTFIPYITTGCESSDCQFVFADLCFQLDSILKELSDYFSSHTHDTGETQNADTMPVYTTLLQNLYFYLEESDTRTLGIIDKILAITTDQEKHKIFITIKNYCQQFDFESGLEHLQKHLATLEGSHE